MKAWLLLILLIAVSCTTAKSESIGSLYARTLIERREGFRCTRAEYPGGSTAPAIMALQERLEVRFKKARGLMLLLHKANLEAAEKADQAGEEQMLQVYPSRCRLRDSDKARVHYQSALSTLERRVAAEARNRN